MAYPAITNVLTAQKPAGIKKVYVKNAAELWQTFGLIRNGELKITPYQTNDTYQRNLTINSYTFEAKFEMLQTALTEIELLPSITDGVAGVGNNFLFQLTDSAAIPTTTPAQTTGWVTVTPSQVKATVKYMSDGNPSTNQFIEVTVKGSLKASEIDACVQASIADVHFTISGTSAQTFSASGVLGNYALCASATDAGKDVGIPTNIKPNGFASVALNDPLSSGAETLTYMRNGKITLDFVSEEDSLGRPNVYAIDVEIEHESTLTDSATLLLMDSMNALLTSITVTLLDGKVFTFANELGFSTSFENVGSMDKLRILRFSHKGRILTSQLAGIVS